MNLEKKEKEGSIKPGELYEIFSKVSKLVKPDIGILFISFLFILLASLAQAIGIGLIIPLLNGLIDKAQFSGILAVPVLGKIIKSLPFAHSDISIFFFMLFLIITAVYVENIAVYLSAILSARVAIKTTHILRSKAFERFLGFEKAFYDKKSIGELNAIITDENIIGSCGAAIVWLNRVFITLGFTLTFLIIMMAISWKLTLSVFALLLPIYCVTRFISKKILLSAQEFFKEKLKISKHSWDVLSNIFLIKLYVTEDKEVRTFTEMSGELARHNFNIFKKQNAVPGITDILNSTGVVIIVCISVFLYLGKAYSLGKFLVFFVILNRFSQHVNQLTQQWSVFMGVPPFIRKILWVFDDSDKAYIKNGKTKFDSLKNELLFKNVCFRYLKDMPTLKDVSFGVKKGQMLAIVGPTGAGKTTLVNLIPRFYEYGPGSIEIDGVNIRGFDIKSLRKKIGVVSQDIMVMSDTIKNNIIYGLEKDEIDNEKLEEAARDAQIYDFIMGLPDKYDTFVGDRGIRLSGGEKQRISIARAILKNPDILILDEATSSLDTETERLIQKAIEIMVKDKTTFVIAHRLSTIKNADWIVVLENGEIKEQGKLQELLERKGRFYYYWELQKLFH